DAELSGKTLKIRKAIFIPSLEINGSTGETNNPSEGVLSGAEVIKNQRTSLTVGLSKLLPHGGTVSFQLYNQKSDSNSIFTNPNPSLYSQATFSLNQPLLKNFGITATKREIYISANNLKIARHQLKDNIITLVYNVEQSYWNLVYAHQNLEATKMALQRARDLLRQNEIKVRVGSAAPIEILTAKADVARNESTVIQAEKSIQTADEALKRILNMSKENFAIIPSDKPKVEKMAVNFNDFLLEGLNNRPDILRAKLDLANFKIGVKYARNQLLPELQLVATYYTTGRGGDKVVYAPGKSPIYPDFNPDTDILEIVSKSIGDAMDDVFSNLYKNFQIQLTLRMPLSFSREKAELAQAKINLKRSLLNLKNVENTIHSEIKEVIKELEANAKLVEADKISLELSGQRLEAEEKRLSVGLTTNFFVLDYQRQYAAAQTQALSSLINYTMTLARINQTLARTLDVYDIKFNDFIK
ncbi:MAG: TolC family protein, partial [bacterium]|nr:TolC family protein [bacterium]